MNRSSEKYLLKIVFLCGIFSFWQNADVMAKKGEEEDSSRVFIKKMAIPSKKITSKTLSEHSVETTDSASRVNSEDQSIELLNPQPKVVRKFKGKRVGKHAAVFKERTGYNSAEKCMKGSKKKIGSLIIEKPEIGHLQGFRNHGASADTLRKNLAVIGYYTNRLMNKADGLYKNKDLDGNCCFVEKKTFIGKYFIQILLNPSNKDYVITPVIVIPSNMKKLPVEKKKAFYEKVERALSTERKNMIIKNQEKNLNHDSRIQKILKKVKRKIKEYEEKDGVEVLQEPILIKFKDQSRSNRDKKKEMKTPIRKKK